MSVPTAARIVLAASLIACSAARAQDRELSRAQPVQMRELAQRLERELAARTFGGIEAHLEARANVAIGAGHHDLLSSLQ